MIVGHVVHHYGKLSESFIPDALEGLERAGAQVWVATLSVEGRGTYPFPPDERLLVCPPPSLPRRALDRALRRSGTERFAEGAAERLREVAPALVHAHFGWAAASGVAVARRLGVPAVAAFHGTDVTVAAPGDPVTRAFPGSTPRSPSRASSRASCVRSATKGRSRSSPRACGSTGCHSAATGRRPGRSSTSAA